MRGAYRCRENGLGLEGSSVGCGKSRRREKEPQPLPRRFGQPPLAISGCPGCSVSEGRRKTGISTPAPRYVGLGEKRRLEMSTYERSGLSFVRTRSSRSRRAVIKVRSYLIRANKRHSSKREKKKSWRRRGEKVEKASKRAGLKARRRRKKTRRDGEGNEKRCEKER